MRCYTRVCLLIKASGSGRRGLVRSIELRVVFPMAAEPVVVVEQFGLATNYWLERQIKHWESSSASANAPIKEFDDMMEASLATATTLYEAVGLRWTVTTSVATVLNEAFSRGAVYQRREGRIDDAIRTSERFMAVAQRLVRDFPMSPASYEVLSQAFLQRAQKRLPSGKSRVDRGLVPTIARRFDSWFRARPEECQNSERDR